MAGAVGDGPQGLPEGSLVEGVDCRGLSGELGHLCEAGLVGLLAFRVVSLQETSLLSAVAAGAIQ